MIQLTTACVSSVDESKGNTSNLLFSGQILPERNAGLNGAPSLKLEPGAACTAAVFDGAGVGANKAAYVAAGAFRAASDTLHTTEDLESIYTRIHNDICAASAAQDDLPLAASAVAACVGGDQLALACLGSCRAYLMRGKSLYLLSRESADVAPRATPPAPGDGAMLGADAVPPFTVKGTLLSGDQLLLCTGALAAALDAREILRVLLEGESAAAALQLLVRRAGSGRGDIAAVLLRADEA